MNKKIIVLLLLCALLVLGTGIFGYAEEVPEGFSSMDEYLNFLLNGEETSKEKPELHNMKLVGTNNRFNMYFYEAGADVFLEEKSTGKVYGTEVDDSYCETGELEESEYSNLLTVSYSEDGKTVSDAELTDSSSNDFTVSATCEKNIINLDVDFLSGKLKFALIITLTEDGISVKIPQDSIKEAEGLMLVSIKLCPFFGAAKPGEDGYVFYPDGSGALTNIAQTKPEQPDFYSYSIYCEDKADFDYFETNKYQDLKSFMLPCFGIKHTVGGIFAEIEQGDENAKVDISINTFYQCCFELNYRIPASVEYEFSSKSSGKIDTITDKIIKGDRVVNFYILSSDKNTYSDMAVLYRNVLVDRKVLNRIDTPLKLSLEFFMGIKKNGILGDKIQKLTTYRDAKNIVSDLYSNNVESIDTLLIGWSQGGYTTLPTSDKSESGFGSQSEIDKFSKLVKQNKGNSYLGCDIVFGNKDTGKFNTKKDTLRNSINVTVTDKSSSEYFLNLKTVLPDYIKNFAKHQKQSSICFINMGNTLLSSLGKTNSTDRNEIIKCQNSVLSKYDDIAVTGGGKYVFSFSNRLYDIPETDSGYYQCDVTVPFYQMVVHGYKSYSGFPLNMSFDGKYQKLKLIETGSLPHYVITEKSPNLLQGTTYDEIYSSKYSDWKASIVSIYSDMQKKVGFLWNNTIDRHEKISDDLVRVVYGNVASVYLNYSNKEISYNGIVIPAMDYTVVKGK